MLKKYGDKFDFMELGKLAIDYSDGIIETSDNVNSDLMEYAKKADKNILSQPIPDQEIKDKYTEFYNNLLG